MINIENKKIIITGGAGYLGESISNELLKNGAKVLVIDNNIKNIKKLKKKLKTFKKNVYFLKIDLSKEKNFSLIKKFVKKNFDKIDGILNLLANNPEVNKKNEFKSFFKTNLVSWSNDINIGLTSIMLVCKHLTPFIDKKGGSIVNLSSDLSVISPDHRLYNKNKILGSKPISYSVIKHGLIGLTKYLSTYLANKKIRVNSVSPGGIYKDQPKQFVNNISKLIPLKRMATRNDINSIIIYLLSDSSSYMTGSNVVIDGGRSVW